jgi:hypothetical protein
LEKNDQRQDSDDQRGKKRKKTGARIAEGPQGKPQGMDADKNSDSQPDQATPLLPSHTPLSSRLNPPYKIPPPPFQKGGRGDFLENSRLEMFTIFGCSPYTTSYF